MSNRDRIPAQSHKHFTHYLRHVLRAAAFLLPFICCSLSANWREYRSDHFQLYSDRKPNEAKALLLEFDKFHQVAVQLLGFVEEPRQPVTVFVFKDDSEFRALEPDKQVAGFYRSSWQGPFMVVGAETKLEDASLVLFHEYVHHLLRSTNHHALPLWFEEGVADLLATAKITGDYAVVGEVHPWREQSLKNHKLLPISELLSVNYDSTDKTFWSRYYASSWLLLHYLHFGGLSGLDENKITSISFLLQQLQESQKSKSFLEDATRLNTHQLEESLKQYRERQELLAVRMKISMPKWKVQQESLDKNQQAFILGELAYRLGKTRIAREYLQQVDASKKSVGPALALRAIIEYHRGQSDIGFHFMSSALKRAPSDTTVLTFAAHLYWDKLLDSHTLSQERQDYYAEKSKAFALKALKAHRENIEALRFLWRVQKYEGNNAQALHTMREALKLKPEDVALNFEVGSYLISQQEQALARPLLELVVEKDHSLKRKQQALTMLINSDAQKPLAESNLDHH